AMVTGIVADILVPAPGETEHGPAAVAEGGAGAQGTAPAAGQPGAAAGGRPGAGAAGSGHVPSREAVGERSGARPNLQEGAAAKVGPNLYGIVGVKRAHQEGFAYSEAVKSLGGQWTYAEINKFIANPRADVPGTKMGFAGLKNVKDRADVIAYLRTLSDSPAPPPTEAETAAEAA